MAKLILFVLSSYAAWFVFTTSDLPVWHKIRAWLAGKSSTFTTFILCPICSGFWVSAVLSYAFPIADFRWPEVWFASLFVGPIVQGLAGAAAIYLIETHVTRLEER